MDEHIVRHALVLVVVSTATPTGQLDSWEFRVAHWGFGTIGFPGCVVAKFVTEVLVSNLVLLLLIDAKIDFRRCIKFGMGFSLAYAVKLGVPSPLVAVVWMEWVEFGFKTVKTGVRGRLGVELLEFRSAELEIRFGRFCGGWGLVAYAPIFTVVVSGVVVLLGTSGGVIGVLLLRVARGGFRAVKILDRVLSCVRGCVWVVV